MKRITGLLVASLLASVVIAGCGGKKVAVRINKESVTEEEFYKQVENTTASELASAANQKGGQIRAGEYVMQKLISDKVITQLTADKKATPSAEQINSFYNFAKAFPELAQMLGIPQDPTRTDEQLRSEVQNVLCTFNLEKQPLTISDADVQALYEKQKPNFAQLTPDQVHVRVIEHSSAANAAKTLAALNKGIAFETAAVTYSENPEAKQNSGDAGVKKITMFNPELQKAIKALKKGEYTKTPVALTVKAPTGAVITRYVLVQLVDSIPGHTPSLNEVRPFIETELIFQKDPGARSRVTDLIREKTKSADIQVNLKQYEPVVQKLKDALNQPSPMPGR